MMKVLSRDDHLIAFDKPSGLAVHRGMARDAVVATDLAREVAGAPVFLVHRLDRGTSGVLLFALDADRARALGRAWEEGLIEKRYLALVRGVPEPEGVIDHPVPRDEGGPRVPAVSHYRRVAVTEPQSHLEGRRFSLVEVRPKTGRFHQIRRHLKHIGHPIAGDVNYGRGEINRMLRERAGLHRIALHAASITLQGPSPLTIEAPLPPDLADPLAALGLIERPANAAS